MTSSFFVRTGALSLVLVIGCGGGTSDDAGTPAVDGGHDASEVLDAGHDASATDGGTDAADHDAWVNPHDAGRAPIDGGHDAAPHPDGGTSLLGDCTTDANCPGGHCVALVTGGFRVCQYAPTPVTSCDPDDPTHGVDQCCATSDCTADGGAGGTCYLNPAFNCRSLHRLQQNECMSDECQNDNDCIDDTVDPPDTHVACVPGGTIGSVRRCISAYCHTDADCTAETGGHCVLTGNECCHTMDTLACAYPSDGCRANVDCTGGQHCRIDFDMGRVACSDDSICF